MMLHEFGQATIYEGNVHDGLREIPRGSINAVVTSPPYWRLRSYLADDHKLKPLELGSERTPEEFVRNLVQVFQVLRPAMADHGVVFVNLGETYLSGKGTCKNPGGGPESLRDRAKEVGGRQLDRMNKSDVIKLGLKPLDRAGIPERFALAMQSDGWYWRDTILWHKPSPMPMSFNGWRWERCRLKIGNRKPDRTEFKQNAVDGNSHYEHHKVAEWSDCPGCKKCTQNDGYVLRKGSFRTTPNYEPIFMFAKTANYFCDREAVAEPAEGDSVKRYNRGRSDNHKFADGGPGDNTIAKSLEHMIGNETRNPRSIWTIGPDNYKGEHYAAFPRELPEKCLRMAMSNKGYCVTCGMPWARVVDRSEVENPGHKWGSRGSDKHSNHNSHDRSMMPVYETIGWRPTCQCTNNTPQPGLVCDPFTGTGTTAEVALKLGHRFFGCELNPVYVDQIRERITCSMPLFC